MKLTEKIGYGFGDMASSMFWKLFSYFLPFFYTNVFGLGLGDAAALMLVTRIWDAVSDPMMGIIADRTNTRWGKYRPYLLFFAIPFAVAGVLLFTTPDFGYEGKRIWAYATYILMMTVYTGINVPYGAMLNTMTTDSDQKSVLSSYRMFFAYAGSFIALFAWEPLCNTFAPAEKVDDSISRIELSSDNSTMTVEVPVDVLEYFEVERSEMQVSDMLAVLRQHEAKELDSKSTYDQIKKFDIEKVNHELDSLNKAHSLNLGSITVNEIGNQYKNISLSPTAWGNAMIVIAVFCFALFILCFLMTREHVKSVSTVSVGKDLKLLLKNKPWWILIGAALASNLFNTVRGTTTAYFFNDYLTRFVEMDSSLAFLLSASIFLSIGEVANMVGVVIAVPMSKHLGKKSTYMISMAALIGLSIAFFFLPATSGGYLAMVVFQIIISVFTGIISPLVWSMYADVADYSELKDGTASTGLIFSSASMAQKFGGAFGGSAVMWLLAAFGYNTAEGAVQTEEALTGLKILMSWVPAIVAALSILVVWFYPLTKKKMQGVQTDLAAKRGDVVAHK